MFPAHRKRRKGSSGSFISPAHEEFTRADAPQDDVVESAPLIIVYYRRGNNFDPDRLTAVPKGEQTRVLIGHHGRVF